MERRNRRSGLVDSIDCRSCGEPVLLDSAKMKHRGDHAAQPCGFCGVEVPLRLSDLNRPPLTQPITDERQGFHLPPLLPEEPIPLLPKWWPGRLRRTKSSS